MKIFLSTVLSVFLVVGLLVRCGSDDAGTSSNPNAVASAAGFAVANVVASTGSASASMMKSTKDVFFSAMQVSGLTFVLRKLGILDDKKVHAADSTFTGCDSATGDLADACADPDAMKSEMEALATASTGTAAATELEAFTTLSPYRGACYGPGWSDNATGSNTNRPTGDLGLVASDLSATDTTACAAGQLTALIAGYPSFGNDILALQAALVASTNAAGKALPAVGETLDGKSDLPAISGITLTTATITRYADTAAGFKVYYTSFIGTDASSKAFTAQVYHVPENDGNTVYKGILKAILPHTATMGGSGDKTGLSMVYNLDASGVFSYELRASSNRATSSTDFFTSAGIVDFTNATSFGEDGNIIRSSFNPTTNTGTMHYAWQAGGTDPASRTFAVHIPAGTEGALTGTAYFGFGARMHTTLLTAIPSPGGSSIWAADMRCNWVNSMNASVTKIQKQTFAQNAAGKFVNSGTAKISFAPTDTCVKAGTWTISNSLPTTYNGTRAAVTVADSDYLTTYTADDIPAVTVTYPFSSNTLPAS